MIKLTIQVSIILSLCLSIGNSSGHHIEDAKRVLVINSYHKGYLWSDEIILGIEEVLGPEEVQIHVVYLDTKREFDPSWLELKKELIKEKQLHNDFDIVMTCDDNAFDFALNHRSELFPSLAIVFCGVNYVNQTRLDQYSNVTGVNEHAPIQRNLKLIESLHPDVNKVIILTDNLTTGKKVQEQVHQLIKERSEGDVTLELLYDISFRELENKLKYIPNDTIVLYSFFFADKNQLRIDYKIAAQSISKACSVPLYGNWKFGFGYGMVGGYLVNGHAQGRTAAQQCLQILAGASVADVPVEYHTPADLYFDCNALKKHNLKISELPEGAILVNKPVSFYQTYKKELIVIICGFALLFLSVCALGYGLYRAKVIHDILERSERDTIARENDLRIIMNSLGEGVISINNDGCVGAMNPRAEELTGWLASQAIGKLIDTIYVKRSIETEEIVPTHIEALKLICEEGSQTKICQLYSRKSEVYFIVDSVAPVVNTIGQTVGVVLVINDCTNEYTLEQKTVQAQANALIAAEASRAKSEFLANMSHEIRTPMNGVMSMADILLDSELNQEQKECADVIRASANNLLTIINDILDFSKIEAGKLDIENIDFDLDDAVGSVVDMFRVQTQEKGLELMQLIENEVPSLLIGDPGRLRQVITNLIGNAFKFTEKGEIFLKVECIDEHASHVELRFSVRDSGIGIPEELRYRLFKKFSQVDSSTTRKYGGTGLGLAISSKLAELMGGEIGVDSEEGVGSTFWFTVKLKKQKSSANLASSSLGSLKDIKVMVIDDSVYNLNVVCEMLDSTGCNVEACSCPVSAYEMIIEASEKNEPYDIILVDKLMPDMDGDVLGNKIKIHPKLKETKLIMMTAAGIRGDAAKMKKIGFSAYLTKPLSRKSLLKSFQMVLGNIDDHISKSSILTDHILAQNSMNPLNILVVEDNKLNQVVVCKLLDKLGAKHSVADNGKLALDILKKEKFDMIFMDCQMPVMDGFTTTRKIREEGSPVLQRDIPIVALTANALKRDEEKCYAAGMNDFITKPIVREELRQVICRVSESKA
ncbi:MAG: response regulator [Planctomycetes bacterium]|nr:response regulator [Planctomycetota bacterium]